MEKEKESSGEAEEQTTPTQTQKETKDISSETKNDNEEKDEEKGNKFDPENSVDVVDSREKKSSSPKISPLPRDHPSHKEDQEEIAKKAETLRDLTKVRKNQYT